MTNQPDYSGWTWQQHLDKAVELAAKADRFGDSEIPSKADRRAHDVQQTTARGSLHVQIAKLKQLAIAATAAPADVEADAQTVVPEPAVTKPARRQTASRSA